MRYTILILFLMFALSVPGAALEPDALKQALPEDASQILRQITPEYPDAQKGFSALWNALRSGFRERLQASVRSAFLITALCLLLSLVQNFAKTAGLTLPEKIPELTGATAVLLLAVKDNGTLIHHASQTVSALDGFTKTLTAVFAVASAAAGRPASAVAAAGATMLFSDILFSFTRSLFLPGVTWYVLLHYLGVVSGNPAFRQAAAVGKWGVTAFFKLFLTAFFVYLTFTGLVTGSADAAAVKTAQSLSGSVPLVGSIIAGASETILAGASMLRAGVGLFGFLGAAAICLAPLLNGICHFLVFKVLSVFAASFAEGGAKTMLESLSGAYSMLVGILTACCAIQFLAIVVSMTVTAV